MGKTINLNLNSYIIFTPTEHTEKMFRRHWEGYNLKDQTLARNVQPDGRIRMQLHEFMNVFGKYMFMGNTSLPLENMNVEIEPV